MLRIRLRRVGKKKQPMYRIVVADSRAPRDGRFVEAIGQYHPLEEPSKIVLDEARARHWLEKGAQPSDRVSKILALQGIAEIPEKLKTRIALGEQRSSEASAKAAAEAKAAPSEAPAEASAMAEATETPAEASAADETPSKASAMAEAPEETNAEAEAGEASSEAADDDSNASATS